MKIKTLILPALLLAVILVGCGKKSDSTPSLTGATSSTVAGAAPTSASSVNIHVFAFQPHALSVSVGTTVTWTNQDDILHTVTSGTNRTPDGTFSQELNGVGKTFSYKFTKAGTYTYFCMRHPGMEGEIDVK